MKLYFTILTILVSLDYLWLGLIAKNIYRHYLGFLFKQDFNFVAAGVFYLLFSFGLLTFVMKPALEQQSLQYAVLYGGLFSGIAYATYNLTNHATIKDWPLFITVIDIAWGTCVGAAVCGITYYLAKQF